MALGCVRDALRCALEIGNAGGGDSPRPRGLSSWPWACVREALRCALEIENAGGGDSPRPRGLSSWPWDV